MLKSLNTDKIDTKNFKDGGKYSQPNISKFIISPDN